MAKVTVIDTPEGIRRFGLLQVYYMLKLEVEHPLNMKFRAQPHKHARKILIGEGRPNPGRTRAKIFTAYQAYLREEGII